MIEDKFYGVVESPGFPEPYPHNRDCTWTLAAPRGNKLNLTFSHFEVEDPHYNGTCVYDYVEIIESNRDVLNENVRQFMRPKLKG